jgi:hypothetical protein
MMWQQVYDPFGKKLLPIGRKVRYARLSDHRFSYDNPGVSVFDGRTTIHCCWSLTPECKRAGFSSVPRQRASGRCKDSPKRDGSVSLRTAEYSAAVHQQQKARSKS